MITFEDSDPEIIFFLGAGASVRAGIGGVQLMVKNFLEKLKNDRNSYFGIVDNIFTFLSEWKKAREEGVVDIELMLENYRKIRK